MNLAKERILNKNPVYQPPWYLQNGLVQTAYIAYWYGNLWCKSQTQVYWFRSLPKITWQEHIFVGADGVPLWGMWSCPEQAKGTLLITYGITGTAQTAWYAQTLAYKAYAQGWAVLLYDWRAHGKTAVLSPVPSSDGWREGEDLVCLAQQLAQLGCPKTMALAGFSLGGQLALWGLKAARELDCDLIKGGAVLAPNLESNRSLDFLRTTRAGRTIEDRLVVELRAEAQLRAERYPDAVKPGAVERVTSISAFDQEMVIDYYGFPTVADYYQKTSGLFLLDTLALPYLLVYAADDPMFEPQLVPEIKARTQRNPHAQLLLTPQGGHVGHISMPSATEDEFWGLNRLLEFCESLVY